MKKSWHDPNSPTPIRRFARWRVCRNKPLSLGTSFGTRQLADYEPLLRILSMTAVANLRFSVLSESVQ
jgi:hypothetical protein